MNYEYDSPPDAEATLLEWIIENLDGIDARRLTRYEEGVGKDLVDVIRRRFSDTLAEPDSYDAVIGNFPTGLPGKIGKICISPTERVSYLRGLRYLVTLTTDGKWRAAALSSTDDDEFVKINNEFVNGFDDVTDLILMLKLTASDR